jgi:hypothetical protein
MAEREGFCQRPEDLENCSKISVSGQPRWVVCTGSMYRKRRRSSSRIRQMVNALHGALAKARRLATEQFMPSMVTVPGPRSPVCP